MRFLPKKIGRITVALGLITLGAILLADNLGGTDFAGWAARLWPLLLVSLGLEYLLYATVVERSAAQAGTYRFDTAGVVLLLLTLAAVQVAGFTRSLWAEWNGAELPPLMALVAGRETAEDVQAREYALASEARRLTIHGTGCTLVVRGAARRSNLAVQTRTEVTAPTRELAAQAAAEAQVVFTGGPYPEVRIQGPRTSGPGHWSQSCAATVELPEQIAVEVTGGPGVKVEAMRGLVQIRANGNIEARGLAGELRVETDWGQVQIEDVAGTVDAQSGHGSMVARRFGGGRLDNTSGDLILEDWTGRLRVTSEHGSVSARLASPPTGEIDLRTGVGRLDLVLPASSSARIEAITGTGRVRISGVTEGAPAGDASGGTTPEGSPAAPGPDQIVPPERRGGQQSLTLGAGEVRVFLRTDAGNIDVDVR